MTGTLFGVGVGPGDPELLTLKAVRLIRQSPVVAYPESEPGRSVARSIVQEHLTGAQIEVPIAIPIKCDGAASEKVYGKAARVLHQYLSQGRDVALLCEGDPFIYGSFHYLCQRLADQFRVTVVPGVSSLTAAAAALATPLVSRAETLTVVPAVLPEAALATRLRALDVAVIVKIGRHFRKVHRVLQNLGLAEKARYIEHATLPDERIHPLSEVDPESVPYFSMILVRQW